MSPTVNRLFNFGLFISVALALTCVIAAIWAAQFDLEDRPLSLGNKVLLGAREGANFRVVLTLPPPTFSLRSRGPTAAQRAAEEEAWGRPNHWLRLPDLDFSLWWPFSLSLIVPVIWVIRRHRTNIGRGFPVEAAPRDKLITARDQ